MSSFKERLPDTFTVLNQVGMSIIYMLLAISVIVAVVFFVAFIFSVRHGQYDDTYTPSVRMLFEDELVKPRKSSEEKKAKKAEESITNNLNPKLK